MEGIYYPYWLYSCKVDGRIDAEGVRRRTTRTGEHGIPGNQQVSG